jgi:hypothetical protein
MNFRKRNWRWEFTPKYSASNLSYNLLWWLIKLLK